MVWEWDYIWGEYRDSENTESLWMAKGTELTSFSNPQGQMDWLIWLGTEENEESICHHMWKWIVAPACVCQWSWLALAWVSSHRLAGENRSGSSRESVLSYFISSSLLPQQKFPPPPYKKPPNILELPRLMGIRGTSRHSWLKVKGITDNSLI